MAQPHDLFDEDDDVDAALTDLQISLEGATSAANGRSHHQVPHLADSLRYFRPRRCVVIMMDEFDHLDISYFNDT